MACTFLEIRISKGIELEFIAKRIGIAVDKLDGYEQNTKTMPCSIAVKLCKVYKIASFDQIKF
ncbi:XRE family transcriptional regulator [Paenibacillus paeoniae]|uniref:XRE family transcriptional regulator n=1 Tax=Paenibacillus paeoniae TaxID=2292705 RepID=A0A371P0A6_9BACL|nr:XRE family transcriptional regulator [Paenibacillus paeoniae]